MRVVSGEYRSRIIKPPQGAEIRITRDEVKAALFNILGTKIVGAKFLDLYAGSGNVGIEALSRGASRVVFVDKDNKCINAVHNNLNSLQIKDLDKAEVLKKDALKALYLLEKREEKFDFVFIDPPYYRDFAKKSLIRLSDCDILSQLALVVIEHYKKDILPQDSGNLVLMKQHTYGDTVLSFYRRAAE